MLTVNCHNIASSTSTLIFHWLGERLYICKDCGKDFVQSNILTIHSHIHKGHMDFWRLPICGNLTTLTSSASFDKILYYSIQF